MQSKYMHCLKPPSNGTWKHKSKFKELPFGGRADFRGNELWFLQIWVSLLRKQERKITTHTTLWHDTTSSGQIDQFNFASHVSKLSNAGWLLPDMDVHSTAVYHTKKYPGAAWASFLLTSPFPHQCLEEYGTRQTSPSPASGQQAFFLVIIIIIVILIPLHEGPYAYIPYIGERAFCSSKSFATRECFQPGAKETNAEETSTSWVRKPTEARS